MEASFGTRKTSLEFAVVGNGTSPKRTPLTHTKHHFIALLKNIWRKGTFFSAAPAARKIPEGLKDTTAKERSSLVATAGKEARMATV